MTRPCISPAGLTKIGPCRSGRPAGKSISEFTDSSTGVGTARTGLAKSFLADYENLCDHVLRERRQWVPGDVVDREHRRWLAEQRGAGADDDRDDDDESLSSLSDSDDDGYASDGGHPDLQSCERHKHELKVLREVRLQLYWDRRGRGEGLARRKSSKKSRKGGKKRARGSRLTYLARQVEGGGGGAGGAGAGGAASSSKKRSRR